MILAAIVTLIGIANPVVMVAAQEQEIEVDPEEVDALIEELEENLAAVRIDLQNATVEDEDEDDDGDQLEEVDLQNALQKQQQSLQTMSNISKTLHDTALSVIRKISG